MKEVEENYDVVVIGSGIGGLTCAAYLAKNGLRTLVLEQHSLPGGYCTSFKRKAFTFDAAVHFTEGLGEGGQFYRILKDLGVEGQVRSRRLDPLYRVVLGGESFSVPADAVKYVAMLTEKFPYERKGISELFRTLRELNDEIEKLPPVLGAKEKLSVPVRFPLTFRYYKKTFAQMMNDFVKGQKLKSLIAAGWPYVGLPPSRVSSLIMAQYMYTAHFQGHYYPLGGTQVLADTLVGALRRHGGELQLSTRVAKILTKNNRATGVEVANGKRIRAERVVSNFPEPVGTTGAPERILASLGGDDALDLLLPSMVGLL
jgi:prolycopene isomerase